MLHNSLNIKFEKKPFMNFIWFSVLLISLGGGSKKVAQKTRTIVERITAIKTFFVSIYLSFLHNFGAGSKPSFPPKNLIG